MFWFKCQLEGLAELTIVKWNGTTTIKKAEYTPLVNHISSDDKDFTVYLLSDYEGDIYKDHYMNNHYWMGLVTYAQLAVEEVMDWYRSRAEEIEHYARQVRLQCCVRCSAFSVCSGCK